MTKILCVVNDATGSFAKILNIKDPLEITIPWLLSRFTEPISTIRASWYTGTGEKNNLYYENLQQLSQDPAHEGVRGESQDVSPMLLLSEEKGEVPPESPETRLAV